MPALSAATPAGFASATKAVTTPARPNAPKPTVVLVHGAFADSSSWNAVTSQLQHHGYPVIAVANPLRGLAHDSAYVSSVLDTIPGPVILAGHSYGGAVITDAATGHPNVKALVYIAAFAPDQGETSLDILGQHPGSQLPPALTTRPYPDGQDTYINPTNFRQVFAADAHNDQRLPPRSPNPAPHPPGKPSLPGTSSQAPTGATLVRTTGQSSRSAKGMTMPFPSDPVRAHPCRGHAGERQRQRQR
ncbi:alpha/beta hydrolase [Streptomyces kaempferi]|uniref:Alpha/beta fold hydrolase n=1 Tax=Streptomyces kaempferi TaxID=333725 RepID=A0ABW3XVC8_9ACTN